MEFIDKRNRVWEVFTDRSHFDCICVRLKNDRDFNSNTSFHFATDKQAYNFVELLKIAD